MSALPATETGAKRRIGDILLAHGFVTPEQIADATAEQERTQQPLGQILVGRGALTRLELASALAEQWSDPAASITPSATRPAPPATPPAAVPSAQDEALYAARLQEAVADLARKVHSNKPLEDIDDRLEELSRRIEATLARTQHIEAAVATLAESLEGVTTGVEEAFHASQSGSAVLAEDLARIDRAIGELAAREAPSADGRALAEIDELRSTIASLSAGDGSIAPELLGRVEKLAERLERIESNPVEGHLRADLENQVRTLDDLRSIVDELRERPTGTPDLDERLGWIESRLETAVGGQAELAEQVGALADRVSDRPTSDVRVDGVLEQLAALDTRLDATLSEVADLRTHLATQDDGTVDERLDGLAQALEVLRGEIADVAAVPARPDDAGHLEELGARIETISREAAESRDAAARIAALEERLRDGFVTPDARVDGVLEQLAALDTRLDATLSEVADLRTHLATQDDGTVDERLDGLAQALEVLRGEIADVAAVPARPDDAGHLEELGARIETISREAAESRDAAARIAALEERLRDGFVTPDALTSSIEWALSDRPALENDGRVEALTAQIDALRAELVSLHEAGERRNAEVASLAEIEARVLALDSEQTDGTALVERLDALEQARDGDLDTLDVLARAMDRVRRDLTEAPRDESQGAEAIEEMAQRIAALEVAREEERAVRPASVPDASPLVSELENVRLVLERIGLHLGEHDKAIADLSPSRGVHERLEEVAALVRDLAASRHDAPPMKEPSPVATPSTTNPEELLRRVEEAEAASQNEQQEADESPRADGLLDRLAAATPRGRRGGGRLARVTDAPGRIRTFDLALRRRALYPLSYGRSAGQCTDHGVASKRGPPSLRQSGFLERAQGAIHACRAGSCVRASNRAVRSPTARLVSGREPGRRHPRPRR